MDATAPILDQDVTTPVLEELQARQGDNPGVAFHDEPYRFDARDWYWKTRDGSLFSSARIAFVSPGDADYIAWAADGRTPTPYPCDPDGNESAAELQFVLDATGGHATLSHYAGGVRYSIEVAGVTVTVGGAEVVVSTARDNRDGMRDTMLRILTRMRKDGDILKIFADGVPRPATNAEAQAAIEAASDHVQDAFNHEEIVAADIASDKIKTRNGVDAAFADLAPAA